MPLDTLCPSAELLRRSLDPDDSMTAAERQRIEAHVDQCAQGCKQAIDVMLRGNTELVGPGTAGPVSAPAAMPSERPARLGRYRIVGTLGSGGFGTVYRGYDDDLRRDVAVKAPHRRRIATPADAEAYLAEARTVAGLDHPHIVPVFDLGRSDDGLCFVVSKFIEGGDLVQKTSAGRPSFAESAALTAAVAEALHHAHLRGLVHRDVKPANILIDVAGVPFLTDFGLALKEEDFGKGGGLAGTPAYMSPEQAGGEGHRVDGRSDVFSLGVVLYELLTGRRPFCADSVGDILAQIIGADVRPPRQIDDAIPKELERICLKALSKRAADRYTTARDLADDLRHFLAGMALEGKSVLSGGRRSGTAPAPPASAPTTALDSRPLKVVPKGLRSFDAHDADFFLELLPGPRDRDGLPDGIRFWKTRIEETDPDDTFAVGLLYGPSGCGKSSLVKAGLLPRLSDDVIAVYVEATAEDTEARLLHGLRKRCADVPADLGLKETLAALRRGQGAPADKKVLIVLDQFEQWLHARKEEKGAELVQALRQCDGGRVQCLVLVRDDFWLAVSRFLKELEVRLVEGRNSALVDLFDRDHARKVLAAFGRAFGKLPEKAGETGAEQKEFLNQAVSALSQDNKVVCVRLALFADMMKGRCWTPAALKEVGGAEGVGATFLEETLSAAAAPPGRRRHQKAARAVLQALLPESGADIKGHMRSRAELLAASGYGGRPGDFDDLIGILDGEIRLITPTDPEGADGDSSPLRVGEHYYQLTHDYLVPSLRDWLTRKQKETRRGRAELLLADRSAVWNARPENRQLPSLWQWCSIRWLTPKKNWTPAQGKMMRRAARHHAERGTVLAILLLLATLAGLGVLSQVVNQNRAAALVQRILDADTDHLPDLIKQLEGCRYWAGNRLRQASVEAEKTGNVRRRLNASLALLPEDPGQVDFLYSQFLDAEPPEAAVILRSLADSSHLETDQGGGLELLKKTLRASAEDDAGKESLAKRQANAAAALVRMGQGEAVWPLLKHSPDPRVRSYLIHRLSPLGADPRAVAEQLGVEKDASIRRALLLILGEYGPDPFSSADRKALTQRVVQLYLDDPDPGLHGAAEWLLRQWGEDRKLKEMEAEWVKDGKKREQRQEQIRQELTKGKGQGEGYWYVNGQGQTMVVIPGPVVFLMGSPLSEVGRDGGPEGETEQLHKKRIGHSYALAAKEVTVEQFHWFRNGQRYDKQYAPTPDCPLNVVTWYDAAAYCNWLSRQEGIPEEQWCYLPNDSGEYAEGMKLAPDYLKRTGYRLPSEAEWEYACRAKAVTSRYYGETEELLGKYVWYTKNSLGRAMLPGAPGSLGVQGDCLKPNDFGLFDMLGNALEWCQEALMDYKPEEDGNPSEDIEDVADIKDQLSRVFRGGSLVSPSRRVRCAWRGWGAPSAPILDVGFRPARTFR